MKFVSAFAAALLASVPHTVLAADWVAERLRGDVFRVEAREWVPIARGDVVPDGTIVWTTANGHVDFYNGPNLVTLSPNTQVKFIEWTDRNQTWIQQWFGEVEVDVEAQNVPHFAVQTPFMVAVVKGTRFTVSNDDTTAEVNMIRGQVDVSDSENDHRVSIGAGQRATGGENAIMSVGGTGILPAITNSAGAVVVPSRPGDDQPERTGAFNVRDDDDDDDDGRGPSRPRPEPARPDDEGGDMPEPTPAPPIDDDEETPEPERPEDDEDDEHAPPPPAPPIDDDEDTEAPEPEQPEDEDGHEHTPPPPAPAPGDDEDHDHGPDDEEDAEDGDDDDGGDDDGGDDDDDDDDDGDEDDDEGDGDDDDEDDEDEDD